MRNLLFIILVGCLFALTYGKTLRAKRDTYDESAGDNSIEQEPAQDGEDLTSEEYSDEDSYSSEDKMDKESRKELEEDIEEELEYIGRAEDVLLNKLEDLEELDEIEELEEEMEEIQEKYNVIKEEGGEEEEKEEENDLREEKLMDMLLEQQDTKARK